LEYAEWLAGDSLLSTIYRNSETYKLQTSAKAFAKEQAEVQSRQSLNPFTDMMRILVKQIKRFSQFNDPNGVYAYWLYDIDF